MPLIALAGCGRIGFGAIGTPGDGAAGGDSAGVGDTGPPVDVTVSNLCPNATPIGTGTTPSIAWTGNMYGVAYVDGLSVRFVPIAGQIVGSPTTLYTAAAAPANPTSTTIVWDGSEHVILYAMDGILGRTVAADGTPTTPNTTLDAVATAIQPLFATGGGALRIDYTSTSSGYQQYTRGVTASPLSVDASGTQLSNSAAASGSYDPALAWTGTAWSAFWDDSKFQGGCYHHGLHFIQIKATGALGGTDTPIYETSCTATATTERHHPFAVANSTDVSLAWVGTASDASAIVVARASPDTGAISSGPTVAASRGGTEVALVWTGSELGVAWVGSGVFLTRADASGVASAEVTFDTAGQSVAIVWDGTHYALVWERGGTIYFARTC